MANRHTLRRSLPALLLACACLLTTGRAAAQISPGKLSAAHSDLEGIRNCTRCHDLGKDVSDTKCLDCHTAIRDRIEEGRGYHASDEVTSEACKKCHSEHHGLDYKLVFWPNGRDSFDHALTGFELKGAHAKTDCRDCHVPAFVDATIREQKNVDAETTFLGLDKTCTSCHVREHENQVNGACLDCHTFDAWSPAPGFNHEDAPYVLTGKHRDVTCVKCHPYRPRREPVPANLIDKRDHTGQSARYADLDFNNCTPCHKDPHNNRFGQDCARCHVTSAFQQIKGDTFDHAQTRFPLKGRHTTVACKACHTSGSMTRPIAFEHCSDCHEDAHLGQFAKRPDGGACENCHTVDGFVPSTYGVEEHRASPYPLTGSHLAVPCNLCHVQIEGPDGKQHARFTFADESCQGCHKDVHHGQLDIWIAKGGCKFCHNTQTWHRTSFDHSLARFPLEGKHREVLCLRCHTLRKEGREEIVWMKPLTMKCSGCHEDVHHGQFVRAELGETHALCQRCHTPEGWSDLTFEHNRDSNFALDGAHARLACGDCHKPVRTVDGGEYILYKPLGTQCADCHGAGGTPVRGG